MINLLFEKTARFLIWLSKVTKLSYETVNIIVYYIIIPTLWGLFISKYLSLGILVFWAILYSLPIKNLSLKLFRASQRFILWFGDYYKWSVIICIFVPIVITILLVALKV